MRKFYLLILMAFSFCSESFGQKLPTKTQDLVQRLDNYLSASETNGYNGAVLVVKGNEVILDKGYGWANTADSIYNTKETVFDICSVTKQFTAAAILKLEEEGRLKLDNPLHIYFKDMPLDKANITIHQLLTHTAGFSHGIGEGDFDHIPEAEYFDRLFSSKLRFDPGEKYSYSNSGYSVLGKIIEKVSGKSYETFLQEKLFAPSGMTQTGYILPNWNLNHVANEYVYNVIDKGNHVDRYLADGKIAWPLKANGGINSTLQDMYRWYLALRDQKVLRKASIDLLTRPHVQEQVGQSTYYAYGWAIFESDRNTKIIGHNGFNGVSYFEFLWFPEEDALILFASNSSTRETSRMPIELERILFDDAFVAEPYPQNLVMQLVHFVEDFSGTHKELSAAIKKKYSAELDSPSHLNRLSGLYLREQEQEKALAIARLNCDLFPNDGNIWDTLGEVYMASNRDEDAIKSYRKALELKPKEDCFYCENALEQIEKLTQRKK